MKKGKFALGALIGAAAGLVAGILTAPKSGKETRNDIKKQAVKIKGEAVREAEIISEKADEIVDEAKVVAENVAYEVKMNAKDLKERADCAVNGAKKGFFDKK